MPAALTTTGATISSSDLTTFVAFTKIQSARMNTNFSIWRGHLLPVDASASAAANNTYDLGSSTYRWRYSYGSPIQSVVSTSGSYSLTSTDDIFICNATTAVSAYLPATSSVPDGKMITVKRPVTSTAIVTLDASGTELIDNTLTVALNQPGDAYSVVKYGSGWYIV